MEVIILTEDNLFNQTELERGIILMKDHEVVVIVDGRTTNSINPFDDDADPFDFIMPKVNHHYDFEIDPEPSRTGWTQKVKSQLFFPGLTHQPTFSPTRNREYKSKSDDDY